MLIDELIEKAFSDGYEYALMEQREYAYPGGMIGTGVGSSGLIKKSLATRPKAVASGWSKMKGSASAVKGGNSVSREAMLSKAKKSFDPIAREKAKVLVSNPKVSRLAPYPRQAQGASNPYSRASQFLSGPGGLR